MTDLEHRYLWLCKTCGAVCATKSNTYLVKHWRNKEHHYVVRPNVYPRESWIGCFRFFGLEPSYMEEVNDAESVATYRLGGLPALFELLKVRTPWYRKLLQKMFKLSFG